VKIILDKSISASELANVLSLKIAGDRDQKVTSIGNIESFESNMLKFMNVSSEIYSTGIVIGHSSISAETLLISEDPRLHFCKALNFLLDNEYFNIPVKKSFIHKSSIIAKSAVIEEGVSIGAHSIIEHNVVIHKNTSIGENCIVRANTVIGAQGFGFQQDHDLHWVRFPHLGSVNIGNNVEIGALNSVCVGSLGDTIIGSGVKTDNLVHIAHNCSIGDNSILTACAELSGSVSIGENVWIGPNSSVAEKISIGKNALVGIGTLVRKNVEEGSVVAGSPARFIRDRKL
jgi:UDP-3-O-[3-hydroxymyristoyl] glucosamine N-acyltransferase